MRKVWTPLLVLGFITVAVIPAMAAYPDKPMQLIVPYSAGGSTDVLARAVSQVAPKYFPQPLVVVNKTGGGGTVGMVSIVGAKPDGYTIGGLWNAPLTMTPHMLPAPYKPADYAAVTLVTWAPTVLCVKAAFPANDGKAFIEELRKNPGKYTYGNDGLGGTLHLASERVFQKVGVKARPIPFAGAGETLKAFLGDHIDIYAGSIAPVLPYVNDKSAKCLMLTSPDRNAAVPQAASLTDLGVPAESTVLWRGILAPKTVPPERLAVLQKAFADAAQSPKFKEFMEKRGEEVRGSSSADFRKLIDSEYAAMGQVMDSVELKKQ
jgi:tripartite-type tricarboxylate transporter receptor subunit TctC